MKRKFPRAGTAALATALLALSLGSGVLATPTDETWVILNARQPAVSPDAPHGLKNTKNGKMIVAKRQRTGISLGWEAASNFDQTFRFHRRGGAGGTIAYEEPIAISLNWGGTKYLRHKPGARGIELSFSTTPAYEWHFTGGARGTPVRPWRQTSAGIRDVANGLYNSHRRAWLIQGTRRDGVSLRWSQRVQAETGSPSGDKCSVTVRVSGKFSGHTTAVGLFKANGNDIGAFVRKYPVRRVRDHREGQRGRSYAKSSFTLAQGIYYVVPAGGGKDRHGDFAVLYKPGRERFRCVAGGRHTVRFVGNFTEY